MAAHAIVSADPSLNYTRMLLERDAAKDEQRNSAGPQNQRRPEHRHSGAGMWFDRYQTPTFHHKKNKKKIPLQLLATLSGA